MNSLYKSGSKMRGVWVFWMATCIHFIAGLSLVVANPEVNMKTTALGGLIDFFLDQRQCGMWLVIVSLCATLGILVEQRRIKQLRPRSEMTADEIRTAEKYEAASIIATFLLIAPQQWCLIVSMFEVITCMVSGRYSDGTVRSQLFIGNDQIYVLAVSAAHSVAIIEHWLTRYMYLGARLSSQRSTTS